MVYQWKESGFAKKVSAETAAKELERIQRKTGNLDPQTIVDESKAEGAPLHNMFQWDDTVAANEYRKQQARVIVCSIVAEEETATGKVQVRQFVSAGGSYTTLRAAMDNEELRKSLLKQAYKDMESFTAKYRAYTELAAVIDAMNTTMEMIA